MSGLLFLEGGEIFEGISVGAEGVEVGELVFHTGMVGYQEVVSDPSYAGQIVVMTYPHIGNYGVREEDDQSSVVFAKGLVVRHLSEYWSSWRGEGSLGGYLRRRGVVALEGIDTRQLTRLIRSRGAQKALIASSVGEEDILRFREQLSLAPSLGERDWVEEVSTKSFYIYPAVGQVLHRVAAYDFGIKRGILRRLAELGCEVGVFPAKAGIEEIFSYEPEGLILSNGPGDPLILGYAVENISRALGRMPIFGICLGYQLLALALGGRRFKLKFGHHGSNHPVKNLLTNKVEITAQNHSFAVEGGSLPLDVEVTHVNLYDGTLEGFRHRRWPIFGVQYHPEAYPGPHDSFYLFRNFLECCG